MAVRSCLGGIGVLFVGAWAGCNGGGLAVAQATGVGGDPCTRDGECASGDCNLVAGRCSDPADLAPFQGHGGDGGGGARPDLVYIAATALTGEPCRVSPECVRSTGGPSPAAVCVLMAPVSGRDVAWPGGYCESPCRPSRAPDPTTGLNNPDCPSDVAVCSPTSQTTGVCMAGCQGIGDCRDEYVCANVAAVRTAVCVPLASSTCDPGLDPRAQGIHCPMAEHCVSYSPDQSYGRCSAACDPIKPVCPPPAMGATGCIVDYDVNDGSGDCLELLSSNGEGDSCFFLNDCAAGMQCLGQRCRQYCRQSGNDPPTPPCPPGQTCHDIKSSGRTIKFTKAVTGICTP